MNRTELTGPEPPARSTGARPPQRASAALVARSDGAPPPFNLRVVSRAVARHWWQILLLWVGGTAGLACLIYVKLKPSYEAVSVLRIEPAPRDLFGGGVNASENFDAYLQTQVQLILSAKVLEAVIADPVATKMPTVRTLVGSPASLHKVVQVQVVPHTYLIEISMKSSSAIEAATVVNAIVTAYLDLASEWSDGATHTHIANLEGYDRRLKTQIDEKQKAWLTLADQNQGEPIPVDPKAETNATQRLTRRSILLEQYRNVVDRLFRARADLIEAENTLASRRARTATSDDRLKRRADELASVDPNVVALAEQIRLTISRRDEARRRTRSSGDPSVTQFQVRLDSLSARYQRLYADTQREILGRFQSETDDPVRQARDAQERVDSLKHLITRLEPMERKLEGECKQDGNSNAVRVALIRESLASLREIEMAVVKRLEQLRFMAGGEPRISRFSEASAAQNPIKDSRPKYLAVLPVALLGLVVALFVVAEVRADRVGDPDELSVRGRVEILGIVPPLPGPRPANGQRAALDYTSRIQELDQSLEHLRVAICGRTLESGGCCVVITSAVGGEGKTNLAVQLAARCANSGESTLLIDADLRRTVLGELLDLDQGPGLSDVLNGDVPVEAAVIESRTGGFRLLPAGTVGLDPGRLFKGEALEQLLAKLRAEYEVIIIDTPPVLPVPDALILGRWCDGAVLAVRHDNSRFPLVERAHRQLASARVPVLGAVVTGLRLSKSGFGTYAYGYRDGRTQRGS